MKCNVIKSKPGILAIDDTPANLLTLGAALADDFDLQFAKSGFEGLKLAMESPPALILLDVMMPGLDGFETCRLFKSAPVLRNIPLVFVTSATDQNSEFMGLSLGAADYITKPIKVALARQRLLNLIEREQLRVEVGRQRDALEAALQAKSDLLHELHNRVHGNLQVISSLLRLEARHALHGETREVIDNVQGRVQCMALLHETLQKSSGIEAVDLGYYLKNLSKQVFRLSNTRGGAIRLHTEMTSVSVGAEQAAPCGLWVNELISNSLRHGFPGGHSGHIQVELKPGSRDGHYALSVEDSGIGLAPNVDPQHPTSLGLQLVADLTKQLGGTLHYQAGNGARFTVCFAPKALAKSETVHA